MNRLILSILLLAGINCYAWGIEKNPDKAPSIGVSYSFGKLNGDIDFSFLKFAGGQSIDSDTNRIMVDGRIPINNKLSLNLALTLIRLESSALETSTLAGYKNNMSGNVFSVGLRYFFIE